MMSLNNELKKTWMEMVLVSFKVVSQHYRKPQKKKKLRTDDLYTKNQIQCIQTTQEC
jgi:hypothetical protein